GRSGVAPILSVATGSLEFGGFSRRLGHAFLVAQQKSVFEFDPEVHPIQR
ncbi:MAG: hypothetical protein QOI78_2755, partial [Actinomycetota bacterium]|nr:hypothetical protein [Actinomycetota bacterium]